MKVNYLLEGLAGGLGPASCEIDFWFFPVCLHMIDDKQIVGNVRNRLTLALTGWEGEREGGMGFAELVGYVCTPYSGLLV